jgi:hypothetical protein
MHTQHMHTQHMHIARPRGRKAHAGQTHIHATTAHTNLIQVLVVPTKRPAWGTTPTPQLLRVMVHAHTAVAASNEGPVIVQRLQAPPQVFGGLNVILRAVPVQSSKP